MPRAGPSRSQRNPSQSQPAPSQTQGYTRSQRRRRDVEEDEEEDEDEAVVVDDDEQAEGAEEDSDLAKKVASLVRLAIFNEQRRLPLKREDISKKVIGSQRNTFKPVFDSVQQILRSTFGMELVELQTRAATQETAMGLGESGKRKRTQEPSQSQADGGTQPNPTQDAMGLKKRSVATGAKAYILRSVLDAELIETASQADGAIMNAEADDPPFAQADELAPRRYGSILAWSTGDTLGALGILHVVLALILVNGKVVNDGDLRTALRRLQLREQDSVDLPASAPHRTIPVDTYLTDLMRKQYIDRVRLGQPTGKRGRGGASQATQGGDDESGAYEWRWGPRAFAEIGEKAIAQFVAEFMAGRQGGTGESSSDEEDANTRRTRRKSRENDDEKRLQLMLREIERAAGGELLDVV